MTISSGSSPLRRSRPLSASRRNSLGQLHMVSAALLACACCGMLTLFSLHNKTTSWKPRDDMIAPIIHRANYISASDSKLDYMASNISNLQANMLASNYTMQSTPPTNASHLTRAQTIRMYKESIGGFVHIGKTAGSTLSAMLRHGCHSFMLHPCRFNITNESMVSQLVGAYYHVPEFGNLPSSNHSFYIITLRDPYDRTISAFCYQHYYNIIARNGTFVPNTRRRLMDIASCFPDLQTFVNYLEGDSFDFDYPFHRAVVNNTSCRDLARAIMHGSVRITEHLYFSANRSRANNIRCS
jgi:Sulfotransferase family